MRFPYQGYPVRGIGTARLELVWRPVVPVRILGPIGDVRALGLLDTGADDTLLPRHFLEPLGLALPAGARARVLGLGGGAAEADYATVDLELRGPRSAYRWSGRVGFYDGLRVVLGHVGALEYFRATFNHRARRITLDPSGPLPDPTIPAP